MNSLGTWAAISSSSFLCRDNVKLTFLKCKYGQCKSCIRCGGTSTNSATFLRASMLLSPGRSSCDPYPLHCRIGRTPFPLSLGGSTTDPRWCHLMEETWMGVGCTQTPRITTIMRAVIDAGSLASAECVRLFEWLPWLYVEIPRRRCLAHKLVKYGIRAFQIEHGGSATLFKRLSFFQTGNQLSHAQLGLSIALKSLAITGTNQPEMPSNGYLEGLHLSG
jgi:hypothetical protein